MYHAFFFLLQFGVLTESQGYNEALKQGVIVTSKRPLCAFHQASIFYCFMCDFSLKDGAYFCYCAYVLRISKYSGFLWVERTNTGIFLHGLELSGESRT